MTPRNTARLSSKFQISIPKSVRDEKGWSAGQEFAFVPRGKGVVLVPIPTLDEVRGLARGADPSDYRDRSDRY
jgi:AbrB family looped-hinge helix DNA binding protein